MIWHYLGEEWCDILERNDVKIHQATSRMPTCGTWWFKAKVKQRTNKKIRVALRSWMFKASTYSSWLTTQTAHLNKSRLSFRWIGVKELAATLFTLRWVKYLLTVPTFNTSRVVFLWIISVSSFFRIQFVVHFVISRWKIIFLLLLSLVRYILTTFLSLKQSVVAMATKIPGL